MATRIFTSIQEEIAVNFNKLSKIAKPETRGDYIRLFRASIDLLPARPPSYENWKEEKATTAFTPKDSEE